MPVDLHLHSARSDGTDDPATIVRLAAHAGLSTIALTDHDTLAGIDEARAAAATLGVRLISGTELSVNWPTGTMHMLVYYLEPGTGPLQDRLAGLVEARTVRNHRILDRLSEHGIVIDHDDVVAEAGGGVIGRPHIASLLVQRGHVDDMAAAFDRWLGTGRPAYVMRERLDAVEAIELALASGGLPVIAHPHTLGIGADEFRRAFEQLAAIGLAGIESHYAEYDQELRDHLAGICRALGLVPTGGSDYHGRYKAGLSVGVGRGDLRVPDEVVEQLDARRTPGRR
ncbi:MAG TPA: PHP domain-containing protein [Acidimicrobiia bacterium]|nr:PHP domain-containing protein [Acidimicrobiia bacterium]